MTSGWVAFEFRGIESFVPAGASCRTDPRRGPGTPRYDNAPQAYRDAITRVIRQRQSSDRNLHLLDGLQLINDRIYLWVTDVVHPNDAGMQRMADGVAAALKPLLAGLP